MPLVTIYNPKTMEIYRTADLPEEEIKKLVFPEGSKIRYGDPSTLPAVVKKDQPPPTDAGVMAKQIADLLQRVTALENNLPPVKG